jgi:hypothetical protein
MKDELYKHIIGALAGKIDGNLFEECSVDLLQKTYPPLVPLKGGSDRGRDGIYIAFGGIEVPLVCTTGTDIRSNLRKNLQQYRKYGYTGKQVLFATSQVVTPQERQKLEEIAAEEGFSLMNVHERYDFANRLYRDKVWLKKLLNIESNQQALSINPITSRPVISYVIRGRDDAIKWLGNTQGDCLVVGQPGSGKTFLVRDFIMENEGLFVVSDNRDQITAEVREKQPKYLVVDDAHTKLPLLQTVAQIREDTGAEYKIIATSWTSYRNVIKSSLKLVDSDIFELELLGRETILQIVKDCGVKGPDVLQAQIVRQAEGKPGLAATLCQLALSGEARDVYLGDTLGKLLEALFQQELGADSLELLSVVALGGDSGIRLEGIAGVLQISALKVQSLATQLGYGGVIAVVADSALSVRPTPLRYYLVKTRFFNGGAVVDPLKYLAHYQRLEDVVDVIIHAGLRGGDVDKAKLFMLVEQVGTPKLFAGYASFGEREAKEVISKYPDKALEEPQTYLAMAPEAIIPLMLDKAVGDHRTLHNNLDHPLRVLQDWVKDSLSGEGDIIARKKTMLQCLAEWRLAGKDPELFALGVALALVPSFETHRTDPGSGRSISFTMGHLSPSELQATVNEWRKIKPLLADLPFGCWRPLIDLPAQWAYERVSVNQPNNDQIKILNSGAIQMLDDLAELSTKFPGIQASLQPVAVHLNHPITITRDREYDVLFPVEDDRRASAWQENEQKQLAAVKDLAAEYATQDPLLVFNKIILLTEQADIANHRWPRHTSVLAADIAAHATNLAEWAKGAITESEDPYFSFPFLQKLQTVDPEAAKPILLDALRHNWHKFSAGEVILRRPFSDDDLWRALSPILCDFAMTAQTLVIRNQVDAETILRLLRSGCGEMALLVAESIAHNQQGDIPKAIFPDWEKALIEFKLTGNYSIDERIIETLKQHPPTIMKWIRAKLAEKSGSKTRLDGYYQVANGLVKHLSRDQRLELINELPDNPYAESIVRELVGGELDLFKALLANSKSRKHQLRPLSIVKGEVWARFAEEAFGIGWDEDEVLAASHRFPEDWSGPASDHYKALMEEAGIGMQSTDPRVVSVAKKLVDYYRQRYEGAIKSEKREEIYGYDD